MTTNRTRMAYLTSGLATGIFFGALANIFLADWGLTIAVVIATVLHIVAYWFEKRRYATDG